MNKDQLLDELGDLARQEGKAERARLDDRWDRLAAGTLTAEEETELRALAGSSPEGREAYEAFRPLGADFQARMVRAVQAEVGTREPSPRILPFRPVARRIEIWLGAAAAMAAGLFLLVRTPALPLSSGYVANLDGGFKTDRGSETASSNTLRTFAPDSPLRLDVSPKQPLKNPGKVRPIVYLSSSAGREDLSLLRLEESSFQVAETGSVSLDVTVGTDLKIPPGNWILWTVIARPGNLPKVGEIQARLRPKRLRQDSWRKVCDALEAEENPPPAPWQVACTSDFRVEGETAR